MNNLYIIPFLIIKSKYILMKHLWIPSVILLLAGIAVGGTSYVQANGQTIAKLNDTGVYYYHSDHLGSTSAMTDEDGKIVKEQVNLPFGEQISGGEKYGFTGKEHDETGLQYFGARYYDPEIGRFVTVDSAQDGVNWFSYALNNPLKFYDPTGNEHEYPLTISGRLVLEEPSMYKHRSEKKYPFYIIKLDLKATEREPYDAWESLNLDTTLKHFDKLDKKYLKKWSKEYNAFVRYLSGKEFGLKLKGIHLDVSKRELQELLKKEGIKMIINPFFPHGGFNSDNGVFYVNSNFVSLVSDHVFLTHEVTDWETREVKGTKQELVTKFALVHELFHKFLGSGHIDSVDVYMGKYNANLMERYAGTLGLAMQDAWYLGWDWAEPIHYKDIKKLKEVVKKYK